MAGTETEAEFHPLKAREAPATPRGSGARDAEKEAGDGAQPRRLSKWRAAAFFLSVYLCLGVAFAFSFVIPCPVRPVSRTTWSRAYDDAAAYAFLAAGDADGDRVQDLLVAFLAGPGSRNDSGADEGSCFGAGFATPCAFLAAHSGTNGTTLWKRPVAQELLLTDCSVEHGGSPACLIVGNPASLALLDLETGQTRWNGSVDFGTNSTVLSPLLKIPDIDKDGVPDFLVFAATGEKIKSFFYSGTFGTQMKFHGTLHLPGLIGHLLHVTKSGAHYILFYTAKAVFAYSLKELYRTAVGPAGPAPATLKEDAGWEKAIAHKAREVPLASSGEIQYVTKMSEKPGSHILVARSAMLELVNGQRLSSLWVVGVPHILREPVLGAFGPDEIAVAIESRVSHDTKKVTIVEGSSGTIKWEVELLSEMQSPKPATLATVDRRSLFLFWGLYQDERNGTGSWHGSRQQRLYLFHPSLPTVLLELSNSADPIVAFEGLLFERSRHACYVLLAGPQVGSSPGRVVLSKRKLKEDIFSSHVIWLNQMPQDTDQNVRDYFHRMRFRTFG
ncbi:PREDICTED: protein ITFG3 [Thamnophis sirtalis]|uniref:Protein ITFG3 n=1 Tax=Thamnophis sirtalis TaxID=35019 RepID=A0A6I9YND4_9SAUR|nr:PREDICTED: protein ITFG3 [Thamnophis sirtalis]